MGIWRLVVVIGALAGCVQPGVTDCGDGTSCPVGFRCSAQFGCISPAQEEACAGRIEGDACSTSAFAGVCHDSACVPAECGNGIVELAEACDDGNTLDVDGCNSECTSDETCGNEIIDLHVGEQCDDNNLRNRDGCSATCRLEQRAWQRVVDAVPPPNRNPGIAYDAARNRVVMFGGFAGSGISDEIWEYDGTVWKQLLPVASATPNARYDATLAYDAAHARIVMFGGTSGSYGFDDTWVLDGITWTRLHPATSPPGRGLAMMTYDAGRGRIVLFGGASGSNVFDDTWEFDGVTWTQRVLDPKPPGRWRAAMAYDPVRERVVLFGGQAGNGLFDDTWEYDGSAWTRATPLTSPTPRSQISMAYAPSIGLVLYGGVSGTAGTDDSWKYNGVTWTPLGSYISPPRNGVAMTAAFGRVVLFGGGAPVPPTAYFNDTYELVNGQWTQPEPYIEPGWRDGDALAYDASTGCHVLFGGFATNGPDAETWTLCGSRWTLISNYPPTPRMEAMLAYDGKRGQVVLFGGAQYYGSNPYNDTWALSMTSGWLPVASTGPSPRWGAMMIDDPLRERVVLFGGAITGGKSAETWELAGSTWTRIDTPVSPPARSHAAIEYDARRDRVVVFGGEDATGADLADTWEYDGTTWVERVLPVQPPARSYADMAYDGARGRCVLYGGLGQGIYTDTWEYDGTTWVEVPFPIRPRRRGLLSYDAAANRIVYVASNTGDMQVWTLEATPVVPGEACGADVDYDRDGLAGCGDDECWGVCSPLCPPEDATCPAP